MQKLFENWRKYVKNHILLETAEDLALDLPGECVRCPNAWGPFYTGPLYGKKKVSIDERPHFKKALENSKEGIDHYIDKWGWPKRIKTEAIADKIYKKELAYAARMGPKDYRPEGYLPETALFQYVMPGLFTDESDTVGGPGDTITQRHAKVGSFKKQKGRRQRPIPLSLWSDYLKRTLPPEYQFSYKTHPLLK